MKIWKKGTQINSEERVILQYGLDSLINSITVIKDYTKLMIPLTTGLITTYFAIFKLIGIDFINDTNDVAYSFLPVQLMLAALVVFVTSSFPVPMRINVGNYNSIKRYRNVSLTMKYIGAALGSVLFLLGIFFMIYTLNLNM
ncbi:hypothetical protein [Candidatus Nitrosocosmicus sp. T]